MRELKTDLREIRIKEGCDYAITHKYGETHVLCNAVWQASIAELAAKHGITITAYHLYS